MNKNCKYEVAVQYGYVYLSEEAYKAYLDGKLIISSAQPGTEKSTQRNEISGKASQKAIKLREAASKSDVYSVCQIFFPKGKVIIPYKNKMGSISIEEMSLSVRSYNGLMRSGADTLGKVKEIIECENGLRSIRNLGIKSEKEVKISFINCCYALLNETEKAVWWQDVIDKNHNPNVC